MPAQPLTVSHPLGEDLKLGFWVNITNQFCQSYPSNVANIIVTYLRESTKEKKKKKQYGQYLRDYLESFDTDVLNLALQIFCHFLHHCMKEVLVTVPLTRPGQLSFLCLLC